VQLLFRCWSSHQPLHWLCDATSCRTAGLALCKSSVRWPLCCWDSDCTLALCWNTIASICLPDEFSSDDISLVKNAHWVVLDVYFPKSWEYCEHLSQTVAEKSLNTLMNECFNKWLAYNQSLSSIVVIGRWTCTVLDQLFYN
jgi:hypothetical protein